MDTLPLLHVPLDKKDVYALNLCRYPLDGYLADFKNLRVTFF